MIGNDKPSQPQGCSCEYVELKTELRDLAGVFKAELAKVMAKVESTEHYMRDIQRDSIRLDNLAQTNRASIASLKVSASMLGAVAGTAVSFIARLLIFRTGS